MSISNKNGKRKFYNFLFFALNPLGMVERVLGYLVSPRLGCRGFWERTNKKRLKCGMLSKCLTLKIRIGLFSKESCFE